MITSQQHMPATQKWAFDESVAECFEDMLQRSIPDYAEMRSLVTRLGAVVIGDGCVIDLGCSRGTQLLQLSLHNEDALMYGLEISDAMLREARKETALIPNARILKRDLRDPYSISQLPPADLVLAVLALQFVPIEYRQRIIHESYEKLNRNGAMIVVEKVLGGDSLAHDFLNVAYYDGKLRNGYSQASIEAKRASLEGVLVPVTAAMNESMLRNEGFRTVECFWRNLNFAGWIAIK